MKNKKRIPTQFIILLAIAVISGVIIGKSLYDSKRDDQIDRLRSECKESIQELKSTVDGYEYVNSVTIETEFDENFEDDVSVAITLEEGYAALLPREKCRVVCSLDERIRDLVRETYHSSGYYNYMKENSIYDFSETVKYRNRYVSPEQNIHVDYYCKGTRYSIIDNTFCVNPNPYSNAGEELYSYTYWKGEVTDFEPWGLGAGDEKSGDAGSGKEKSGYGAARKTYDPYDANEYKSAQDFADDKYEEFFDYEDDYEDEDEAYDAAEDYWDELYD